MATSTITNNPSIVESGTSGIWTYRKWSDGTAECWGTWSGSKTCSGGNGSLYDTSGTQTLPFTFASAPRVMTNAVASGGYFAYVGVTTGVSSLTLQFICSNNSARTWTVNFYVIGKWE